MMETTQLSMLPKIFRIVDTWRETEDVFSIKLKADATPETCDFQAGQFNMLYAFGMGEVPISLSGDPTDKSLLIHTIREVGAITTALGRLKINDVVGVRGPFGQGWPQQEMLNKDLLLIAGGIGIAPLRPIIYNVCQDRGDYRKVTLLLGARSPQNLLFSKELERLGKKAKIEVITTVDSWSSTTGDTWHGRIGVVTKWIDQLIRHPEQTLVCLCGPEIMMRFAIYQLLTLGIAKSQIYLSLERNMKCAVGFCGHCQWGEYFLCKQGAIFNFAQIEKSFSIAEL